MLPYAWVSPHILFFYLPRKFLSKQKKPTLGHLLGSLDGEVMLNELLGIPGSEIKTMSLKSGFPSVHIHKGPAQHAWGTSGMPLEAFYLQCLSRDFVCFMYSQQIILSLFSRKYFVEIRVFYLVLTSALPIKLKLRKSFGRTF